MPPLMRAAQLFPLNHYYRFGPAHLILDDNEWYRLDEALPILRHVQKNDPHSAIIATLIKAYEDRAHVTAR